MKCKNNNPFEGAPIRPLNRLLEITRQILIELYGALGSEELSIEGFLYFDDTNEWEIELIRKIDDLVQNIKIVIDNDTGMLKGFRRDK